MGCGVDDWRRDLNVPQEGTLILHCPPAIGEQHAAAVVDWDREPAAHNAFWREASPEALAVFAAAPRACTASC